MIILTKEGGIFMALSDKLQEIRRYNELSQDQFAEMLGVSRQSVSKWERGHGYPEIEKLIFISERFSISLDELLKDSYVSRRTISLNKDDVSPHEEIYPGQQEPAPDLKTQTPQSFRAPAARYNYASCSQNISAPAKKRRKLNKAGIAVLSLMGASALFFFFVINVSHQTASYTQETDNISVDYTDGDNIKCLYNENNKTYYLVDSDNGIADGFYSEDFDNYIKLTDLSTNEVYYVYDDYETFYSCENVLYTDQNNNSVQFIIPEAMMPQYISSDELNDFLIMKNENGETRFVPKNAVSSVIDTPVSKDEVSDDDTADEVPSVVEQAQENKSGDLESVGRQVS